MRIRFPDPVKHKEVPKGFIVVDASNRHYTVQSRYLDWKGCHYNAHRWQYSRLITKNKARWTAFARGKIYRDDV